MVLSLQGQQPATKSPIMCSTLQWLCVLWANLSNKKDFSCWSVIEYERSPNRILNIWLSFGVTVLRGCKPLVPGSRWHSTIGCNLRLLTSLPATSWEVRQTSYHTRVEEVSTPSQLQWSISINWDSKEVCLPSSCFLLGLGGRETWLMQSLWGLLPFTNQSPSPELDDAVIDSGLLCRKHKGLPWVSVCWRGRAESWTQQYQCEIRHASQPSCPRSVVSNHIFSHIFN